MKNTWSWLLAVVAVVALAGCGADDPSNGGSGGGSSGGGSSGVPLPTVDCNDGPVPTYADLSSGVFQKCETCHSSSNTTPASRYGAPGNVNFDVEDQAKQVAEIAVTLVYTNSMPPSSLVGIDGGVAAAQVTPTEADKTALYRWALCGTP